MNFVHPLRSPRAPAEGSMEKKPFVGFSPSAGAAPCADCIGYPRRKPEERIRNDERKEARHTSRVPILTSRSSPGER